MKLLIVIGIVLAVLLIEFAIEVFKKKPLYKLYDKLYKYSKKYYEKNGAASICYLIGALERDGIITFKEWDILYSDFKRNRPKYSQHRNFYNHPLFTDSMYWFVIGERGKEIRLEFIKYLRDLNK